MREHRQMRVPPMLETKPRSRSSRGATTRGKVPARRAICAALGLLDSKRSDASVPGETASKIAAAMGLAHRTQFASALHSHTGVGLKACAASRGSFSQANWNSVCLLYTSDAADE